MKYAMSHGSSARVAAFICFRICIAYLLFFVSLLPSFRGQFTPLRLTPEPLQVRVVIPKVTICIISFFYRVTERFIALGSFVESSLRLRMHTT